MLYESPGGNQVDGLPPVAHGGFFHENEEFSGSMNSFLMKSRGNQVQDLTEVSTKSHGNL